MYAYAPSRKYRKNQVISLKKKYRASVQFWTLMVIPDKIGNTELPMFECSYSS